MLYLNLVKQFKSISGLRGEQSAPKLRDKFLTVSAESLNFHYVLDLELVSQILSSPHIFKQDLFLSRLLNKNLSDFYWIHYFVKHSPEFLDQSDHLESKQRIKKYMELLDSNDNRNRLALDHDLFLEALDASRGYSFTANIVAKEIVRKYLENIFSILLSQQITVEDNLLEAPDIFTPTIKINKNLNSLNNAVNGFMASNNLNPAEIRDDLLLTLLSFMYMSIRPLRACITTLLNHAVLHNGRIRNPQYFIGFKMVPTFFVAREAIVDFNFESLRVSKGDKLYLYLYNSSGCPFSSKTLPFGKGSHFCSGYKLSQLLVRNLLEIIASIKSTSERINIFSYDVSEVRMNTSNAFLDFI